ncbi:8385_t:CDS:2 [Rhizophagus irregularis]|nr:8385_t:CDS:2 [Rhizophagus irregularis]
MANSWHAYFDETDVEDWDVLQFHIEWIQRNPVNLAYDKSSDTLAKGLRAIVNKCSDDKKVTKAKSLLADIKDQRKKGNDIDKLWLTIENKMCALQVDKEKMNLEILQIKGIAQATSQSQSYASTLNDSALSSLKLTATKVNQDQELPGSNKDEIQNSTIDGSENKSFLVSEDEV